MTIKVVAHPSTVFAMLEPGDQYWQPESGQYVLVTEIKKTSPNALIVEGNATSDHVFRGELLRGFV